MKIEKLHWMLAQLKEMSVVTQSMIDEVRLTGGTPEPDAHDQPVVEDAPEMSYQDVQAIALTLIHVGGRDLVAKFVQELGVESLKKLPKERYADAVILGDEMRRAAKEAQQ